MATVMACFGTIKCHIVNCRHSTPCMPFKPDVILFPLFQVLHFPPELYTHVIDDLKKQLILVLNKVSGLVCY